MPNRWISFDRIGKWAGERAAEVTAAWTAVWCFTRDLVVTGSEAETSGGYRIRKKFGRGFLFTTVSLVALWALDPVGVASNSDRISAELFYRIVSPGYAPPTNLDNRGSRNPLHDDTQIAVIVINDETLQTWEELRGEEAYWPPAFPIHAQIIEKILLYNPKALLIDFGFFDPQGRGDITKLTGLLESPYRQLPRGAHKLCESEVAKFQKYEECEGEVWNIPVFLAGAPRQFDSAPGSYELEVIPALQAAVTGTVSTRYSTGFELPYNSYPLFDCFTEEFSAALAMYAADRTDWTAWGLLPSCRDQDDKELERRDWAGGPNAMSVYWASWGDEANSRGSYRCKSVPGSIPGRIVQIVQIWLADLFGDSIAWREQFQVCPPHRAYAAHDFLADESPELAEFLDGRYVFYGGNFTMADDMITPPTHGPVPGVFLHAMALDNLLRFDGDYIRIEGGAWPSTLESWLTVVAVLLVGVFTVLAWNGLNDLVARPKTECAGNSTPKSEPTPKSDPEWSKAEKVWSYFRPFGRLFIGVAWFATFIVISGASVVAIVWFGFSVLNLAPINFVGILAFIGIEGVIRTSRALMYTIFLGAL